MNLITSLNQYKHKRGIERETLRMLRSGRIAVSNHPNSLGSKLTNKNITVDFSEGLLELITEPYDSINKTLSRLEKILAFTTKNLPTNEIILAISMPLGVTEKEVKISDFGTSNSGRIKEVYRRGLAKRYGKIMQIISGIHYNFSYDIELMNRLTKVLNMDSNTLYFSAINNYFEFMWLLPYLFGASPICAKTSVEGKPEYLISKCHDFYISEYATSLRMSNIGYQSIHQNNLFISHKNLESYVYDLVSATETSYKKFKDIGLFDSQGRRQQLNDSILQIENEYYSTIRPKQVAQRGERPAHALLNRGISYLEARVLDVNPFSALGIDKDTAHFIESMLLTCLLLPFKSYSKNDYIRNKLNFSKVVLEGRNPQLKLRDRKNNLQPLRALGLKYLEMILFTAKNMGKNYYQSVDKQASKLCDPSKTLSGQLVSFVGPSNYRDKILELSMLHTEYFQKFKLDNDDKTKFAYTINESIKAQKMIENIDCHSIDDYIYKYYVDRQL